ncbi:MAG TPA: M81 family metallopeptidase [Nevskiaceae bacterium]|nr:M81 family metallopeptidase [Nevskiaceae bacterium]
MKIFSAFFATETNTSAVVPTGFADFERIGVYRGDASARDPLGFGASHVELKRLASADGHVVVESVTAHAHPAGITVRQVYERYRDWILEDLRAAMPVQAVVLALHGAMVADGYDDCEGDLIARVREMVGPKVPIGVELDLHCHVSRLMLGKADVIVCYKEYPHTDTLERLGEVYRLVVRQAQGEIKPVTAVRDLRMVGIWHTTREPMASFVKKMKSFEGSGGILSVSLGHGFPWGDVADTGAKLWVIADSDQAKAQQLADQLGDEFWRLRDQTYSPPLSIGAAIEKMKPAQQGPIVFADVADNAGGGAMSDSTFILKAMLDAGIADSVIGSFWDLGAVELCKSAGVGARLNLRIGGKCGPQSGDPVDVAITVKAILENHAQFGLNFRWPLGTCVWVQTEGGIDILLNTIRSQIFGREAFEGLGIHLEGRRAIVVKSTQHFYASFAPLAKEVLYVGAPGSITQNFAEMTYRKRDNYFWPRVADPFKTPMATAASKFNDRS